jgi:hypothetical protein
MKNDCTNNNIRIRDNHFKKLILFFENLFSIFKKINFWRLDFRTFEPVTMSVWRHLLSFKLTPPCLSYRDTYNFIQLKHVLVLVKFYLTNERFETHIVQRKRFSLMCPIWLPLIIFQCNVQSRNMDSDFNPKTVRIINVWQ